MNKEEEEEWSKKRVEHYLKQQELEDAKKGEEKIKALRGHYRPEDIETLRGKHHAEWEERFDATEACFYLYHYKVVVDPPNILKLDEETMMQEMLKKYREANEQEQKQFDEMLGHYNVKLEHK